MPLEMAPAWQRRFARIASFVPITCFMPAFPHARMARIVHGFAWGLCAVFAILCLSKARLIGDGLEYLTMAQGFVAHGSPELRRSDVDAFQAMPAQALARARLQPAMMHGAIDRLEQGATVELGYARARDGSIQAIHFWLYSLLAAPFFALVALFGQNPFMALVALNLAILALSAWRVRASLPGAGLPELGLLLLMGPMYYTVWSGPEVMAGCCVLLAVLAALRRDLPASVALAGLGATQNPSIAGLIVAAGAYWLLYRLFPAAALFPAADPARGRMRDGALVVAGLVAAGLPWLHNLRTFGVPSIIGRYYNDASLVTPERMFSFLFDLNQGLLIGFPALLSCFAVIVLRLQRPQRRAWLLHAAIALLLTLGLALPTLSASNWNSGSLVVSRYAYWASMPMLAVCLAGMVRLGTRSRVLALLAALVLQGLGLWQAYRPGAPSFLSHGRLAQLLLDHAPRYYNPDPEIFAERERRREPFSGDDQVVLHQGPNGPTKLMRFWSNGLDSGGLCAPGTHLAAGHTVTLDSGWRYYNAPLRCDPGPAPALRARVGATDGSAPVLGAGWRPVEGTAVWTDGARSTLTLRLPDRRQAHRIALDGVYFTGVRSSRVRINGVSLGDVVLGPKPLPVPEAARSGGRLELTLEHRVPAPASPGAAPVLGYLLRGVHLELAP